MTFAVTRTPTGSRFAVKVVPGASRDRLVGVLGDALKVQVSVAAEHGKANERLCELLATALRVAARDVQVDSGHRTPRKTVAVRGLDPAEVQRRLASTD